MISVDLPPGWVPAGTSHCHPTVTVYRGGCAGCGRVIYRTAAILRTRKVVTCSKVCIGRVWAAKQDRLRWHRGRAYVFAPDHPSASMAKKMVGYVKRSRAVYEATHGIVLPLRVLVHHRNEDPTDDRAENLEVMSRADHRAWHARAEKARYGTIARHKDRR